MAASAMATQQRIQQGQLTEQAFSVVQNVLENGIASVCYRRHLFPPSFFQHSPYGRNGDVATQFHMEAILSPHGGSSSSNHCKLDLSANSERDVTSESSDSPTYVPESCSYSPLTAPPSSEQNQTIPANLVLHPSDTSTWHDLMRAEAALLLSWLRRGIFPSIRSGQVSRVHFGICIPSNKRTDNNRLQSSCEQDQLAESYSFDILHTPPSTPGQISVGDMQNSYERLFRNMNALLANDKIGVSKSQPGPDVCCLNAPSTDSREEYLFNPPPVGSRYFTLRVEFRYSVEPGELPYALHLESPLCGSNNTLMTNADAEPREAHGHVSMGSSLKGLASTTPIGDVVDKNFSGLGVRLYAMNREEESANKVDDTNNEDFVTETENPDLKSANEMEEVEGHSMFMAQSETDETSYSYSLSNGSLSEQHVRPPNSEIFSNGDEAMAIPYGCLSKKNRSIYTHCRILECREVNATMEYKVLFSSRRLQRLRRQKQWIGSHKILSVDDLISRITDAISCYYKRNPALHQGLSSETVNMLGRKLLVPSKMIERADRKIRESRNQVAIEFSAITSSLTHNES